MVMVLPAVIVGALSAVGAIPAPWAGVLLAVALSLALTSAGSAYWRRHASGDVLFSDLLLWGWLRRRRMERRLGRADDLLERAGTADAEGKADLLHDLGVALDAQDPYLDGHSRRVARFATMTATRLGLPADRVDRVKAAALIHDIGKLHIPQEIVTKAGRLSAAEFALMKQHAGEGGAMVECLGDAALVAAVRSHHERWDGDGYPDGLAGDVIAPEARIISVVDTFDAITSPRSYRAATTHVKALKIIEAEAGHQFDPDAAHAFISCYSDRRGAALWAGLAALPRQLAERLAITPGEIVGAVTAALTAPLLVVAGAMAAQALPVASTAQDEPLALSQASRAAATATPGVRSTPTPTAAQATTTSAPQATSKPAPGGVAPVAPTSRPRDRTATPQPEPSAPPAATPGATAQPLPETPTPEPSLPSLASAPELLPPALPAATAAPTPTGTPSPEPSPSPEPTAEPGAAAAAGDTARVPDSRSDPAVAWQRRLQERRLDGPRLPEPGPVHRRRQPRCPAWRMS